MAYNITAVSNISGVLDFVQKIDDHIFCIPSGCGGEGGLLGTVIIIIIFGILMINFIANGKDPNSSLSAASFICLVVGGLFFLMGIISEISIYITLLIWGISVGLGSRK
uniref:Uncharacterized protein n=1 Tax=viral metagenome TaxID=1070528 RepID=A0A6H1ZJP8_9ZZZZ